MTENIPEIIEEPKNAGCQEGNETIGYLAGEISRLRGDLRIALTALEDLSFDSFGVIATKAPSIDVYNSTFLKLDELRTKNGYKCMKDLKSE